MNTGKTLFGQVIDLFAMEDFSTHRGSLRSRSPSSHAVVRRAIARDGVRAAVLSTIDLRLSVPPWASFRSTKAAVQLREPLDLRGLRPGFIYISDGKLHEVEVLDMLLLLGAVERGAFGDRPVGSTLPSKRLLDPWVGGCAPRLLGSTRGHGDARLWPERSIIFHVLAAWLPQRYCRQSHTTRAPSLAAVMVHHLHCPWDCTDVARCHPCGTYHGQVAVSADCRKADQMGEYFLCGGHVNLRPVQ